MWWTPLTRTQCRTLWMRWRERKSRKIGNHWIFVKELKKCSKIYRYWRKCWEKQKRKEITKYTWGVYFAYKYFLVRIKTMISIIMKWSRMKSRCSSANTKTTLHTKSVLSNTTNQFKDKPPHTYALGNAQTFISDSLCM